MSIYPPWGLVENLFFNYDRKKRSVFNSAKEILAADKYK